MSVRPLISIIMPIYNAEKYVCETINSILNQSFNNFEVILVNDGSVDRSGQICDEYSKKDTRIRVFHIENNGPGNARNYGISLAKGEYIQFVDSDDELARDMLEQLINCITNEPSDIVVCGVKKMNFLKQETIHSLSTRVSLDRDIKKDFIKLLKMGLAFAPWNKLYKKEIIDKYKIKFNNELRLGEDALFNIDYFSKANKVYIFEKPLYIYFQRTSSLTNKYNNEKERIQILLYNKLMDFFGKEIDANIIKEVNAYYLMEFSYVIYQNSIGIKNIEDFTQKVKDTKRLINSPEFKAVKKNNYPYSLIQRVILVLCKLKCEPVLLLILYFHNKLTRPLFMK